jgi:hypothetical protein
MVLFNREFGLKEAAGHRHIHLSIANLSLYKLNIY